MDKNTVLLFFLLTLTASLIDVFTCCSILKPDQIGLALAGDTGVSVRWHLKACPLHYTDPCPNPKVTYGTSFTALTLNSTNGRSTYYKQENLTGTSWFCSVELENLSPSTIYYYQIVQSSFASSSSIFSFKSAPPLGSQSQTVNIAVYGDLGLDGVRELVTQGPCLFQQALNALEAKLDEIDLFLHLGDICYADVAYQMTPPKSYEEAIDECQSAMSVLTSERFYMTAIGNHEIYCPLFPYNKNLCSSKQLNQNPYTNRFRMPSEQSGGYLNSWYSFNYGFIHFIALSCESDFPGSSSPNLIDNTTQITWLINDLSNVDRSITPWIIVYCHRPWKGSKTANADLPSGVQNCNACQQAFENILNKYKVDIYIAGHIHWYERICVNGTVNTTNYLNPNGIVYLTIGGIGNPEGLQTVGTRSTDSCALITIPGFGIFSISDSTHATFTYYRTNDSVILDQFHIIKNR